MVNTMYKDHLEHHGILGQKWGVRRFQNRDGSLTAAGKKRNSGEDSTEKKGTSAKGSSSETTEEKKKGLSDSQKKALKVGAAAVVTALAAYGGYKMTSNSIAKQNSIYSMYGNRRKGSSGINKKDLDITKLGKTVATTNKSFDQVFNNVKGQQKFNRASKANDDYVSQLLKKNAGALANYSMSDLMKMDLY